MRTLILVLVVLVLLSYVPPVRSGVNAYIRGLFSTCWRGKGFCRKTCRKKEEYHIFCESQFLCCVNPKFLPAIVGK
ncbi:beta-defensin 135 [Myotis lucifugus]|uniref:Beta-defensin n=1 Tax=Myotis lucifugus TaxID=59463 RepID=G1Q0C5_MYOLU|nr:beta-defensin 135 [Myotis lucifugus]